MPKKRRITNRRKAIRHNRTTFLTIVALAGLVILAITIAGGGGEWAADLSSAPKLDLSIAAPESASCGEGVTIAVTVKNAGNAPANRLVYTFGFLALHHVSESAGCKEQKNGEVTCAIPADTWVEPGASHQISLSATVSQDCPSDGALIGASVRSAQRLASGSRVKGVARIARK